MAGQYVLNADGALEWEADPTEISPDTIDHCTILGHDPHNENPDPQRSTKKKAGKDG